MYAVAGNDGHPLSGQKIKSFRAGYGSCSPVVEVSKAANFSIEFADGQRCRDAGREDGDEDDRKKHPDKGDDSSAQGLGSQIPIAHGAHRDHRPPYAVADSLRKTFEATPLMEDDKIILTHLQVAIGVGTRTEATTAFEDLFKLADHQMYQNKAKMKQNG